MPDIKTERAEFMKAFKDAANRTKTEIHIPEGPGPRHITLSFEEEQRVGDMLAGGAVPEFTMLGRFLFWFSKNWTNFKKDFGILHMLVLFLGVLLVLAVTLVKLAR